LASAYYAARDPHCEVDITVYDTQPGPGLGSGGDAGASSAPVTLLHPFTPKGKLIWRGLEGFHEMLTIMADTAYSSTTSTSSNSSSTEVHNSEDMRIFRPFYDVKRFDKYKREAEKHPQVGDQGPANNKNSIFLQLPRDMDCFINL
jgi:hypothetical protein